MLGLYIHIPFCLKRCGYCDFVSVTARDIIPAYVQSLIREIKMTGELYRGPVDTVYFGGGTPSFPDAEYIEGILDAVRENYPMLNHTEITIEANPCTLTDEKLKRYKEIGINRLSLGLQSYQNKHLLMLGRAHTAQLFDQIFDQARSAGFDNINVDVLYAYPRQTLSDWEHTLAAVLKKDPEHISAYAVKLSEHTPLYKKIQSGALPPLADQDTDAQMYETAEKMLSDSGYQHYEISNFAKEGRACTHNLKYWNIDNYLGIGVGASSCIDRMRFTNVKEPDAYIASLAEHKLPCVLEELCDDLSRESEYIMLRLRLADGISFYDYKKRFGKDFAERFEKQIEKVRLLQFAEISGDALKPTERGFALQNQLVSLMLEGIE